MTGRSVEFSENEVVLPHFTEAGQEMVIPIARIESENNAGEVILHPAARDNHLDGSLILTLKRGDKLIVHGVPQDGPSANFFLTLTR